MVLLALLLAATSAGGSAARDEAAYLALGASYSGAGRATAVASIRAWTSSEVSTAQRRLRSRASELRERASAPLEIDLRFVESTALLHLEAGLRSLQELDEAEGAHQLAAGAALVQWVAEAAADRAGDPTLPAALRLHPRVAPAAFHAAAADAALAVGFPAIAEAHGEQARDAAPTDAEALLALALARDGLAHLQLVEGKEKEARRTRERAEEGFRDVLAVDPTIVEARVRLGWLLAGEGHLVEAEPLLDQSRREGSARQRYLALLFLGRVAEGKGDFDAALSSYSRALEAQPDGSAARLGLALQLERRAGPAAARTAVIETLSRSARLEAVADPWSSYPFGDVDAAAATLQQLWEQVMAP